MRDTANPTVKFASWIRQAEKAGNENASYECLMEFSAERSSFRSAYSTLARRGTRLAEEKLEISDVPDSDVFRNNMETSGVCARARARAYGGPCNSDLCFRSVYIIQSEHAKLPDLY